MRPRPVMLAALILVLGFGTHATADPNDDAVGLGLDQSKLSFDSLSSDLDFSGFTAFLKIGADPRWGIILAYRSVEDDEDLLPGEEISYTQAGIYGTRVWRPEAGFRPHVKFGFIWMDFTLEATGFPTLGETTTGFAVGGGFELGSQRVALLVDYEYGIVELFNENVNLGDLMLGVVFKY